MTALEKTIERLGLTEKVIANKAKNDAIKALKDDYKAKSDSEKDKMTKAEMKSLLDSLTA